MCGCGALACARGPTLYTPPRVTYGQVVDAFPLDYFPLSQREKNTTGRCVHSATASILKAPGEFAKARQWQAMYDGGEYSTRLAERLSAAGITFVMERGGDDRFLDWCCGGKFGGSHRMAAVTLITNHVLNLCAINSTHAYYLNNWVREDDDAPNSYRRSVADVMTREAFVDDWRKRGGWAFTLLEVDGRPLAPPLPRPVVSAHSSYRGA